MTQFKDLITEQKILRAVEDMGYTNPTEIQEKAMPLIREGKDIIAKSNTGTGKTAAFGLPLLEKLHTKEIQNVIILCPTRELVLQVVEELRKYSKYLEHSKVVGVYGGAPIDRQIKAIKQGASIIVGTPGRVLDHIRRKTIRLANYNAAVLDEADEMLNMGFREDIESILGNIKGEHQTVLFSATMPKAIRDIAKKFLNSPSEVEVKSVHKTVDRINQIYFDINRNEKKNDVLLKLLKYYNPKLCIIFCNTKTKVDEVTNLLVTNNLPAAALHGDIKQDKRTKIMANFKQASRYTLVASDVAARGIDVNNIDLVINFDFPQDNEIYVHRIGRTGRAGKDGFAITLIQGSRQFKLMQSLMKFTKADIKRENVPTESDMHAFNEKQLYTQIASTIKEEGIMGGNIDLANQLVKEGFDPQEIISALISLVNGHPLESSKPKKKKAKIKDPVDLKFTIGLSKKIAATDIEAAIVRDCEFDAKKIGTIDMRKTYTIVTVDKKDASHLIEKMSPSYIHKHVFEVSYYRKKKQAEKSED